jgi:hypothetical protein
MDAHITVLHKNQKHEPFSNCKVQPLYETSSLNHTGENFRSNVDSLKILCNECPTYISLTLSMSENLQIAQATSHLSM